MTLKFRKSKSVEELSHRGQVEPLPRSGFVSFRSLSFRGHQQNTNHLTGADYNALFVAVYVSDDLKVIASVSVEKTAV